MYCSYAKSTQDSLSVPLKNSRGSNNSFDSEHSNDSDDSLSAHDPLTRLSKHTLHINEKSSFASLAAHLRHFPNGPCPSSKSKNTSHHQRDPLQDTILENSR